jgi:hypothetical protein
MRKKVLQLGHTVRKNVLLMNKDFFRCFGTKTKKKMYMNIIISYQLQLLKFTIGYSCIKQQLFLHGLLTSAGIFPQMHSRESVPLFSLFTLSQILGRDHFEISASIYTVKINLRPIVCQNVPLRRNDLRKITFVFSETYWVEKLKADNKDYYEDD